MSQRQPAALCGTTHLSRTLCQHQELSREAPDRAVVAHATAEAARALGERGRGTGRKIPSNKSCGIIVWCRLLQHFELYRTK